MKIKEFLRRKERLRNLNRTMRTLYDSIEYIRGCIQTCQKKKHIQQVAFSTYHDALTQVCFTCEAIRTSISHQEVQGSKKGIPFEKGEKP